MDGLSDGEEEFKDWQDFTLASELERFEASLVIRRVCFHVAESC